MRAVLITLSYRFAVTRFRTLAQVARLSNLMLALYWIAVGML